MFGHEFILTPGTWLGEGFITLTMSPAKLRFYTKWIVEEPRVGIIHCQQRVEVEGRDEDLFNHFIFSDIKESSYSMQLTNAEMGTVKGTGVISPKLIAWEYRHDIDSEGFDVYELQPDGNYIMHAEFISTVQYRTIVDGRIWKKSTS